MNIFSEIGIGIPEHYLYRYTASIV